MRRAEHFARRFVRAAYGRDHQVSLFAFEDVAADGLAQPFVAVAVQQVVLQLECQSQFDGEAAQLAAVLFGSAAQQGADRGGPGQQHRGLQLDHVHVFHDRNLRLAFEIHVVLLSFAHFERHGVERREYLRQQLRRHLAQQPVGADQHGVTREDRHVLSPLGVDRGFAAPHGCIVHDVVVQQREVMEHLDGRGGRQGMLYLIGEDAVGEHQQHGAQALAAARERIADRGVK